MCCIVDSVTVEGVFRQLKEVEDTLQAAEALCAQQSPSGAGRNEALPSLPLVSCHTDLVLKRILRTWLEGLVDCHNYEFPLATYRYICRAN